MFIKFSRAALRIPHLTLCAVIAVTLAACGSDATDTPATAPTAITSGAGITQPPVINNAPPTAVTAGSKYQYIPSVSAAGDPVLSYDVSNKPDWATFAPDTGELSGIPQAADVGSSAEIEIGVSDGTSRATIGPFRITVNAQPTDPNPPQTPPVAPPTIAGVPAAEVTAGQAYAFVPAVSNPSGEALSFTIVNRPSWATFSTATGKLAGKPTNANIGSFANILISVTGGSSTVSLPAFSIQVEAAQNNAPTIAGTPSTRVLAGASYSFTPDATDPDGLALTFSITHAPAWSSFDAATGRLSGTPHTSDIGSFSDIVISVSDGNQTAALPAFEIEVRAPVDNTPTIAGTPATRVTAGSAYSFKPSASDPQGNALTFAVQHAPSWATFNAATGEFAGTPTSANIGVFANIIISVSDGSQSAALPAFSIQVQAAPDHAPVIGGTPAASVVAGSAYSFRPTASDPDGNPLSFSISNQPSWASFSANNGQLTGTPSGSQAGTYANIVIRVSDGTASAALPAFSIEVDAPADRAPSISGSPPTGVVAGSAYSFRPMASDPDGTALVFSVSNLPSWATFSATTGQLSGTPSTANVGSFANIVIAASDGTLTSRLPAFTITVSAPANPPPTISGTPATSANAGTAYSFTPTASDPNHNTLTFSIVNLPGWAAFNAQSGTLSGTPASADAGTYSNISIRVSDGASSAALASFSITVTQSANGTASLSWVAPTQNTDGSALTNLAGYTIYYGTSASDLSQHVKITNAGLTTYVLSNLGAGTWYFSINDYTSAGVESAISNIVSKTFP